MSVSRRLGIMGGTFDPVHNGHIAIARAAADAFGLDKVVLMPAGHPALKSPEQVSHTTDRLAMTALAAEADARFSVSSMEVDRPGPTYTVDTLEAVAAAEGPGGWIGFIVGTDALVELPLWKDAVRVAKMCTFLVAERPGLSLEDALRRVSADGLAVRSRLIEMETRPESSTEIRRRVREGGAWRGSVPAPVAAYIDSHGLYGGVQG